MQYTQAHTQQEKDERCNHKFNSLLSHSFDVALQVVIIYRYVENELNSNSTISNDDKMMATSLFSIMN